MISIYASILVSFVLPIPLIRHDIVIDFIVMCLADPMNTEFYDTYDLVAVRIFGEGVLGILILIFTCLIICVLFNARRRSQQMGATDEAKKARSSQDAQINNMLLFIVFMFFFTRFPYTISYFLYNANTQKLFLSYWGVKYITLGVNLTRAFSIFNYSTNFIIYIVFVRTFRNNLVGLCRKSAGNKRNAGSFAKRSQTPASVVRSVA